MDAKNFTIGILSTTAVILLVGLFVIHSRPEPSYASGMNAQGGDYLLTTGQLQDSEELLYVVDAQSRRMVVYRFDINRKQIQHTFAKNLSALQGSDDDSAQAPAQPPSRRGRRR
jgi:hypothetical protein